MEVSSFRSNETLITEFSIIIFGMNYVDIGLEEKARRVETLIRLAKSYPKVSVCKSDLEVRDLVLNGTRDFLTLKSYWSKVYEAELRGIIRPIVPYGRGDVTKGFHISAISLEDVLRTVNYLVERESDDFLYMRCFSPDMPPGYYVADVLLKTYYETLAEYRTPGPFVRREYVDL